jgi:hypothetical protein
VQKGEEKQPFTWRSLGTADLASSVTNQAGIT